MYVEYVTHLETIQHTAAVGKMLASTELSCSHRYTNVSVRIDYRKFSAYN